MLKGDGLLVDRIEAIWMDLDDLIVLPNNTH